MNTDYRAYTAEQLQQQYSARDAVPEHLQIFQFWQQQSEAYRAVANAVFDLSYGESERQKLDLFLPLTAFKPAPLFIFMHGGYWQAMSKDLFSFIAKELNKHGIAVAILNYDLCPTVTLDEITSQIRQAICWLGHHADEYSINKQQLHLCGHSAGGHLTAAMMATDWQTIEPEFDSSVIRSGLSISGVFELEPLIYTGINQALGLELESARRNSPALASPTLNLPLTLLVGGNESAEFHRQSQQLAKEWGSQGVLTQYESLPGLNHFTMINEFALDNSPLLKHALDLVKSGNRSH